MGSLARGWLCTPGIGETKEICAWVKVTSLHSWKAGMPAPGGLGSPASPASLLSVNRGCLRSPLYGSWAASWAPVHG